LCIPVNQLELLAIHHWAWSGKCFVVPWQYYCDVNIHQFRITYARIITILELSGVKKLTALYPALSLKKTVSCTSLKGKFISLNSNLIGIYTSLLNKISGNETGLNK
jgi:predicted protein tyrosine phosphatase